MPASFSVWIESIIPSLNSVQSFAQHYDATNNRAAINSITPLSPITTANGTIYELYDFNAAAHWSQTLFTTGVKGTSCRVDVLNTTTAGTNAAAHALLPFGNTLIGSQLSYAGQRSGTLGFALALLKPLVPFLVC